MADSTPQRDRSTLNDGPVMGDHPDLEADETYRPLPVADGDDRSRQLWVAGIIALVIIVIVAAILLFS
jgi:hypothetical protein